MLLILVTVLGAVLGLPKAPAGSENRQPEWIEGCTHSSWCCRMIFKDFITKEKESDSKRRRFNPAKRAMGDPIVDSINSEKYDVFTGRFYCVDTRSQAATKLRNQAYIRGPYILKCKGRNNHVEQLTARSFHSAVGPVMREKVFCGNPVDVFEYAVDPGQTKCVQLSLTEAQVKGKVIQAGYNGRKKDPKPVTIFNVYTNDGKLGASLSRNYFNHFEGLDSWTFRPIAGLTYHFCLHHQIKASRDVWMYFDLIDDPPDGIDVS